MSDNIPNDTNLDLPGLARGVREAEDGLRDHFKATSADLDTTSRQGEPRVTYRLEFRGFTDLGAALDRIREVANELEALPETERVDVGATTHGGFNPAADEVDDRPFGWVNAELAVE